MVCLGEFRVPKTNHAPLNESADPAEDMACVRATLAGDTSAFTELVARYQPLVDAYARRLLDDLPEAEDVVQEAFLKAYRELASLQDPERFGAWLKSITWRECRAWVRSEQVRRNNLAAITQERLRDPLFDEVVTTQPDTDADAGAHPWLDRLAQTLDDMQSGSRTVLALFYVRGMPHARIAQFLNIPVGTVKRRLFDGRKSIAGVAESLPPMERAEREQFVDRLRMLLTKEVPFSKGEPS